MTNDTRSRKLDKALLLFAIAYSAITMYFISGMLRDQSASLGYVILFPVFWAIAGLLLGLLFWLKTAFGRITRGMDKLKGRKTIEVINSVVCREIKA